MKYGHEFDDVAIRDDRRYVSCLLCGRQFKDDGPFDGGPCPERIVQEVVSRIREDLQKANVIQAKRRHQTR